MRTHAQRHTLFSKAYSYEEGKESQGFPARALVKQPWRTQSMRSRDQHRVQFGDHHPETADGAGGPKKHPLNQVEFHNLSRANTSQAYVEVA